MSVPDNNHRQNDSKTLSKAESMNKKTNAKVLIPYYIYIYPQAYRHRADEERSNK